MKKHDEVHDENRGKNAELSSLHEVQAEVRALKMELSEKALREEKMEAKLKAAKEEVERLEQSFTEKRTRDLEAKQQMIGLLEDRLSTEKRERKRMGELHSEQLSAMEEKYDAEKAAELEAFEARVR